PLVGDICSDGDSGAPTTLKIEAAELTGNTAYLTPEAEAFGKLAENVVKAVDRRNETLPPTHKVEVNKK
ncbi:MAG: hypothetical protein K2M62_00275, partial [Muribaculaceae bacterium]|nr:hypothetical protein [Muribaculaceae bacterium]